MISIKGDVDQVTRWLTTIERKQVPFARALALTRTAEYIAGTGRTWRGKGVMQRAVRRVFDKPTRFTERSFYSIPASRRDPSPQAVVQIKDGITKQPGRGNTPGTPAFYYLQPQMYGGQRRAKGHEIKLRRLGILGNDEYTVPGEGMRLNRFGNITGATYSKILADVQGAGVGIEQGFGQATTSRGRKRYFYHPNLRPRGIYVRKGKRIYPALLFVKAPKYRVRLRFHEIAERAARKRFPIEFRRAMEYALRTAR